MASVNAHLLMAEFVTLLKDIKDPQSLMKSAQDAAAISSEKEAELDAAYKTIASVEQVKADAASRIRLATEAESKLEARIKEHEANVAAHAASVSALNSAIDAHRLAVEEHKKTVLKHNSDAAEKLLSLKLREDAVATRNAVLDKLASKLEADSARVEAYEAKLKARAKSLRETAEGL